ncbi:cytochrome c-type biogenesis protein [Gilvimarinus algae]|uniref:Cytochrome c-type biogenesis protein n=1 Tax=Gilvimarinus algae TaxID=3058037 RepID=A0ABT8TEF2_9GAMM|nr:cytochrome c-type biogenesis protein [Gilvimarinus sp. SDUM040014]MDO3382486.1 cytochrome c-type biogenesis protein CcmH [Gilvimarinus sp. SDUM040014]
MRLLCVFLMFLGLVCQAEPVYEFDNPVDRARFQQFNEELRCPQCQNQNLAGSDSLVSETLREDLYEQILAGRSDKEIIDDMVRRYGDYILYRPPFDASTAVLWLGPFGLLLIGGTVLLLMVRRRARQTAQDPELSAAEQARLQRLLDEHDTQAASREQP